MNSEDNLNGEQVKVLKELESLIGIPIPLIESEKSLEDTGYKVENGNIVKLNLSYSHIALLPESIKSSLALKANYLTHLPESIGALKSLRFLNLSYNQLIQLPESIRELVSLRDLDLSYNKLSQLSKSIGGLVSLKALDLSYNELSQLPESIGLIRSLKTLSLFDNQLTSLPESIGELVSLESLSLGNNPLKELPKSIETLISLKSLSMSRNHLTHFPVSITTLKSLDSLKLNYNQLTKLPESIGVLKSLSTLILNHNQLTHLPKSIGELVSLENLHLDENQLTELPESIGNLSSLKFLNLRINKLKTLPESIGNLKSLRILILNHNQLDHLPKSIGELVSLENLHLDDNQLIDLPETIKNLQSLSTIQLENNKFPIEIAEKLKSIAIKSRGNIKELLLKIAFECEKGEIVLRPKEKLKNKVSLLKKSIIPLLYAGCVASIGLLAFLTFNAFFQDLNPLTLIFFCISLGTNFFIGASIISIISKYLKKYGEPVVKRIEKKQYSFFRESKSSEYRGYLWGAFDFFVVVYLIWSIRALVKIGLTIELFPSIDFVFEYVIPEWVLNFLQLFGYNTELRFLENLDFFFGHFYIKLFGIALIFWALYKYGMGYMRKTVFEKEDANKNLWYFLIFGLVGGFALGIINYSSISPYLSFTYYIGVIIGASVFIWDINKDKPIIAYFYFGFIASGIIVVWILSLWNIAISFITGGVFVLTFWFARSIIAKPFDWRYLAFSVCIIILFIFVSVALYLEIQYGSTLIPIENMLPTFLILTLIIIGIYFIPHILIRKRKKN